MSTPYTDDGSQAAGGSPESEPQTSTTPTLKDQVGAARDRVGELNRTVRDEARGFASSTRQQASQRLDQRKQEAAGTIHDFADAIRRAGDELGQRDRSMPARLASQAAESLEGMSRAIADKSPGEMIDAVRDFGRRNPTAMLAGSLLVGLAVGRFLRSSAPYEDEGEAYAAGIGVGGYERETLVRGDVGSSGATAATGGLDANSQAFDANAADAAMTPEGMGRSDAETGGVVSASGLDDSVGMSAGTPSDTGTDANSGIAGETSED
ncbi:MAG: hypothetical protein ACM3W4_03020 [Ignavibacteriales bacterium]